ncbi:hypothetical protein NX801_28245 [Streptomyces sp. LP05-1]|uniref:Uncharacterized protein n=1 Tax=Streptomyces pyxinae TaxID=2970734 RepID=A0ABT2CPT7_9ACTN|nr:hypothetical protein [Streptomyces sp. LP05-1]MCS0639455.1 hypothetical protein [Streptomyces sp. LP05-1]
MLNPLVFTAVPVLGVLDLRSRADAPLGFWPPFLLGAPGFLAVTLFDLLVIDRWLSAPPAPVSRCCQARRTCPTTATGPSASASWSPGPVPWPLVLIPGYDALVGALSCLAEALGA